MKSLVRECHRACCRVETGATAFRTQNEVYGFLRLVVPVIRLVLGDAWVGGLLFRDLSIPGTARAGAVRIIEIEEPRLKLRQRHEATWAFQHRGIRLIV